MKWHCWLGEIGDRNDFVFRIKVRTDKEAEEIKDWFARSLKRIGSLTRVVRLEIEYPKERRTTVPVRSKGKR